MLRWNRRSKAAAIPRIAQLERELDLIKSQILLVTTDMLPGCRVVKMIGYVESLSETEAGSDWEYRIAEKEALLGLAQKAVGIGANAVVGIKKINAHYDQAGSQWRVSRVAYCGTAVVSAN